MKLTPTLASGLNWLLIIALVLGNFVIKPAGGLVFHVIVAGLAAIPAVFAGKTPRIIGGVVLGISLVLALMRYPEYRAAEESHRLALEAAVKEVSQTPPSQRERI